MEELLSGLSGLITGFIVSFVVIVFLIGADEKYNSACTEAYYKKITLEVCHTFLPPGIRQHNAQR